MCLARGGEWIGFGLTNTVGTGGVLDVSVFWLRRCRWGVGRGLYQGIEGMVLCLSELRVWIICVDCRSRYLCIVLGGYLRI